MLYKPSLVSTISVACLILSTCLISSSLMAQTPSTPTPSPIPTVNSPQSASNLITNNPFVPKNNGSPVKAKNPIDPQSIANKSQILQKYLQFKSIAIINKKKYFSVFNKRTNKSFWISEGSTVENFRVMAYCPITNSITITDGINTEVIPIIAANETPLSVASAVTKANNSEAVKSPIPGNTANQNNDKPKAPPRRRIVPVKR